MTSAKAQTELVILPERQLDGIDGRPLLITGYLCRMLLALFTLLAFGIYVSDALDLNADAAMGFGVASAATLLFGFMGRSKRCFAIGGGIIGVILAYLLISQESPMLVLFHSAVALSNAFCRKLVTIGYPGMAGYVFNFDYSIRRLGYTEEGLRRLGFAILLVVMAAILAACLLRRAHTAIPILTIGPICSVTLYYGMAESSLGFALIVAAGIGISAMSTHDGIYASKRAILGENGLLEGTKIARLEYIRSTRRNTALGGFTGVFAAMLSLLLLLPTLTIKETMKEIPAIADPALKLENFFVAAINGENPDLGSLIFSGVASIDKRDTGRTNPRYTGEELFVVGLDTSLPVYLRNWVGSDYYGNAWHTADYDEIADYKSRFGEDFTPEELTTELLALIDPELVELPEGRSYKSFAEYGYVTAKVDIRKSRPTANLVYLPSYTDLRFELLQYRKDEPLSTEISPYYDGIFSSTGYLFIDDYSVVARLQTLRNSDFAAELSELIGELDREEMIIESLRRSLAQGVDENDLPNLYTGLRNIASGLFSPPEDEKSTLAWRYAHEMTPAERAEVDRILAAREDYEDYVYEHYTEVSKEDYSAILPVTSHIVFREGARKDGDRYVLINEYVMSVIDYLSANMVYTLTPKLPSEEYADTNAAVAFLMYTKEGYCVHFATSAVLLLRSLGIPARYAEGYIASSFARNQSHVKELDEARYSARVLDSSAHAWIEVYFPGYGWIQYEATTPYISQMYEGSSVSESVEPSTPSDTEPIYEESTDTSDDTVVTPVTKPSKLPKALIPAVLIAVAIAACVILVRYRISSCERRALELINRVRALGDSPEENSARMEAARELNRRIFRLLSVVGLEPVGGETLREFAERADGLLGSAASPGLSRLTSAIQASEFGLELPRSSLEPLGSYYRGLRRHLLTSGGRLRRFVRAVLLGL